MEVNSTYCLDGGALAARRASTPHTHTHTQSDALDDRGWWGGGGGGAQAVW